MSVCKEKDKAFVNIALIAVNVLVFLAMESMGSTEDSAFMRDHGAVYIPLILLHGEYYRVFTAMFLHFGAIHLVNNMLVLLALGDKLEGELGHVRYLLLYIVSGISANLVSMAVQYSMGRMAVTAGASGAIFGVVGSLAYVVAINHGQIDGLTNRQLGFIVLLTLYHGFTDRGVDNAAHIGGLVSGFILGILLYRRTCSVKTSHMRE